MAVTLIDELALSQPQMRKGVIQTLVEQVMLQDRVPYETTGALQVPITYLSGVPTVPLRHINETPAGSEAQFAQAVETLHIVDTDIDIDPVLIANKNQVQSIEVAQTKAVVASIGYRLNDLLVNGDPSSDSREPIGLKARLRDDSRYSGQTVNATADATELDASPDATDANLLSYLNKLDELLVLVEDNASVVLLNRQGRLATWAGLRKLKLLDTTKDQFDREILQYRGTPFIDPGFKPSAAVTGVADAAGADANQIIGFDADDFVAGGDPGPGNGANGYEDSTTIYVIRFSPEYAVGLQQEPMRVKAFGETEAAPHVVRTNIRWVVNPLVGFQKRSMGRLVGVKFV